jgi:probable HAF family extracellular repeat protein
LEEAMKTATRGICCVGFVLLTTISLARGLSPAGRADSSQHSRKLIWTQLDVPGAIGTVALGINSRGDMVGQYQARVNEYHICLIREGVVTDIDPPGSDNSAGDGWAVDINDAGAIVGKYKSAGDNMVHGFLLDQGEYSTIDPPGSVYTEAAGINPRGEIVGLYVLADGSTHGFHLYKSVLTTIDYPDPTALGTITATPSPNGEIVGWYDDADANSHGFILRGGIFTLLNFPDAVGKLPFGINASGEIIGSYSDDLGGFHGFLFRKGGFLTIDPPGSVWTLASGINSEGEIVGFFVDAYGVSHGFLLQPGPY